MNLGMPMTQIKCQRAGACDSDKQKKTKSDSFSKEERFVK